MGIQQGSRLLAKTSLEFRQEDVGTELPRIIINR